MSCGKTSASPAAGSSDRSSVTLNPCCLGSLAVIGEVEALLDQRVDIDDPVLARALARMQQHVLDDRIGALAVLDHLVEIAAQHSGELVDLLPPLVVDRQAFQRVLQLVDQLARDGREVVDEIERVLDLVRDAGGELAERGELLRLHQAVLRSAQVFQRSGQLARARLHLVEQSHVFDRDHRLIGEGLTELDLFIGERASPHYGGSRVRRWPRSP